MAGCHRCLWFSTRSQNVLIGLVDSNSMCQSHERCSELCSLAYVTALQLHNKLLLSSIPSNRSCNCVSVIESLMAISLHCKSSVEYQQSRNVYRCVCFFLKTHSRGGKDDLSTSSKCVGQTREQRDAVGASHVPQHTRVHRKAP